jgi:hypothetical protein
MAAEAGIPREVFAPHFYNVVRGWPGSAMRDDQIQNVIDWAYNDVPFLGYKQGSWPIVVNRDGFDVKVDPDAEKKLRNRQVLLEPGATPPQLHSTHCAMPSTNGSNGTST